MSFRIVMKQTLPAFDYTVRYWIFTNRSRENIFGAKQKPCRHHGEKKKLNKNKRFTRDGRKGSKNTGIYRCANCLLECPSLHSNSLLHCPSCGKATLPSLAALSSKMPRINVFDVFDVWILWTCIATVKHQQQWAHFHHSDCHVNNHQQASK